MMLNRTTSGSGRNIRRAVITAASTAVIASFIGAPVAQAGTHHAAASAARSVRPHVARPAPHSAPKHHAAAPKPNHSAKRIQAFGLTKPARVKAPKPNLRRASKPAPIKSHKVPLWHGTPSYTLGKNTRLAPASITGITGSCQITAGNHSGTWSPASCPKGYEIQGDVTVPVGQTLTIKPNTIVYFDTTVAGSLTPGDVSELNDLIVDGTLNIAGTAAQPVLITSANASPDSVTSPQPGDYGYIFFNHTGSNKGTGAISHMRLLYGEGIASDRSAPAIANSTISNIAAGTTSPLIASSITKGAGIDYEDITGGSVVLNAIVFDGAQVAGIKLASDYHHTAFNGAAVAGAPFTVSLTNSAITGGASSNFEDAVQAISYTNGATVAANHAAVALNVHGNTITETRSGYGFEVEAETNPAAVAGTGAIAGAFHDNAIQGGDTSYGVYMYAYAADSGATGTKACGGESACVSVPFINNQIGAYYTAVELEAYVTTGAGGAVVNAPIGKVVKKTIKKKHHKKKTKLVDVSGGYYQSADDDAFESYAYAYGTGPATSYTPNVATKFFAYDNDLDSEAFAYAGNGVVNADSRHSTMTSSDYDNIYIEAYGSENGPPPPHSAGSATGSVVITGGKYSAYDYNVYNSEVSSYYGPGTVNISVTGAQLTADDDWNIYTEAYGSYSGGNGAGTSKVNISKSSLASYYGAVENYAYGYNGAAPATATVTVDKSTIAAYDEDAIENYAYSAYQPGSHGAATANTSVSNSTVNAYYNIMDVEAESKYGGSATSSPKITNSTVVSTDDYGIENYVYGAENGGSGTVVANPVISKSTVDTYDDAIYNYVYNYYGAGDTTASPRILKSNTSVADDDLIYNYVQGKNQVGSSGKTIGSPVISGGSATAYDDLIDNDVQAYYGPATGNPVLQNVHGVSGDDYAIYNEVYASQTSGTGAANANPVITGSNIHSYDSAIYNESYSYGGSSTANPLINTSTAVASDYYGIYNESYSNYSSGTGGTSTGNPTIIGSTLTSYDEGIYNDVYSYQGVAVGNPTLKNSTLTAVDDDGIDNYVYGSYSGSTGSGNANPSITGSQIKSYDYGLYNEAYGYNGKGTASPVISNSDISSLFESTVDNYAYGGYTAGTGSATASPAIKSSSLACGECSSYYALYNEAESYGGASTASPAIASSNLRNAEGYGVDNESYSADTSGSATAKANPVLSGSSIVSYYEALYNYAKGGSTNSAADGSPTVKGGHIHSLDYPGIDTEAYSTGTGTATLNPAIDGVAVRAPDDDGIQLYAGSAGTGATTVGGHISTSTITAEGGAVYVDAAPTGVGSSSSFTTTLKNDVITSTDGDGIDAEYATKGASNTISPTISGGSITADEDYAMDLEATGYGAAATDALRVTPTVTGVAIDSYDGTYLYAADSLGSASPGRAIVGGAVTGGSIVTTDYYGVYSNAKCSYCAGGAKNGLVVTNTPIRSYDAAVYAGAVTTGTTAGSAVNAASVTSTNGTAVNSLVDYGIAIYATGANGDALDSAVVKGMHVNGYYGGIYNDAKATNGSTSDSASYTANLIDNLGGTGGEYGIYDGASANGGTGNVARTGSISKNTIRNYPEGSYGIYEDLSASVTSAPKLTIASNRISNIGYYGLFLNNSWATAPPASSFVTVSHNTISRVGSNGIYLYGATPNVNHNKISNAGLDASGSDLDGVFIDGAPNQGSLTCNVIFGNALGVEYGSGNPTSGGGGHNGDPATNNNSFKDPNSSIRNSTDLKTSAASGTTDAQSNYWGGTPRVYPPASKYDLTPTLSKAPKCVKTAGA